MTDQPETGTDLSQLLQPVLDSSDEMFFAVDLSGRYTGFNAAHAVYMKRYHGADIARGESLFDGLSDVEVRRQLRGALDQVLETGEVFRATTVLERGGTTIHLAFRLSPLPGPDGAIVGAVVFAKDETARVLAHKQALAGERRFHLLFERHKAVMLLVNPMSGQIVDANKAAVAFYGYDRELLQSMTIQQINMLSESEIVRAAHRAVSEEQNVFVFPHRLANGEVRMVEIHSSPVETADGTLLFSVVHDVTARLRAEAALRARLGQQRLVADLGQRALSGEPLAALLDDAVRMVADTLAVDFGKIQQLLPSGEELLLRAAVGWDSAIVGVEIVGGDDASQAKYTIRSGVPVVVDDLRVETRFCGSRLLTRSGVVSGATVLIGKVERPWGVLGVHSQRPRQFSEDDVSFLQSVANVIGAAAERARAEDELREREQLYRTLIDVSPDEICITDAQGLLTFISPRGVQLFGLESEREGLGTHVLEWFEAAHRARAALTFSRVLNGETVEGARYLVQRRDGASWWAEISASMLPDSQGRPAGLMAVVRDVTDREHAETALRESEDRYRSLVESFPDGIVVGQSGKVLFANAAALRILGIERIETLQDPSLLSWVHPDDVSVVASELEAARIAPGTRAPFEFRLVRSDGVGVHVEASVLTVPYDGATVWQTVFRDVSARKTVEQERERMQAEIAQAQRMDTIGNLAGGIAHDFNNILSVILNYAGFLLDGMDESDPSRDDALEIQSAASRAADLTRQLLAFSSRQKPEPQQVSANQVVGGLSKMLGRLIGEHIRLEIDLQQDAGFVFLDPSQLEQVLMNLAVNARDAMPEGGCLTIATERCSAATGELVLRPELWDCDLVRISITDTGTGIDPEVISRIFEPYFTTKPKGKGTGLGLSVVYRLVRQNGDAVTVDSKQGKGSTFRMYFRRVASIDSSADDSADSDPCEIRGETVLLVEDEDGVRKAFSRMLGSVGYEVIEAFDGQAALAAFSANPAAIDLVLTDIVMPGMTGVELGRRLEELRPGLKVIYCSGYTDDLVDSAALDEKGALLLHKPVRRADLLRAIRRVLDG